LSSRQKVVPYIVSAADCFIWAGWGDFLILRQAADGSTAKKNLQSRFDLRIYWTLFLLCHCADSTGLERQNLYRKEFDLLSEQTQMLQRLLSDRRELLKRLKKRLCDRSGASMVIRAADSCSTETGDKKDRRSRS